MMLSRRHLIVAGGAAAATACTHSFTKPGSEADIVIIGAGLSGLHAASILENAGAKVVVLEGAGHVGGRLHTLDGLPGHPEAGGIQIGSFYKRLIAEAKRLGVELKPGGEFDRSALYVIGGQTIPQEKWSTSNANKLIGPERQMPPAALGSIYGRRMPQLSNTAAWMTEEGQKFDVPYSATLKAMGASDEAIRLIGCNLDRNMMDSISALNTARTSAIFQTAGKDASLSVVNGGSQRLPEAMAAALRNEPRLGQVVTGISENSDGVRINIAGGKSITAKHVICTVPFSVLRTMGLEGPSAAEMKPAIDSLPYTHASFAYISAREPFWKSDGLPETIWSDDPQIGRVFVLGDSPPMLKVWLSGTDADAIDRLSSADAGAAIIARLEAVRPAARGQLRLEQMFSWQKNTLARGTYHYLKAGQSQILAKATNTTGRRLHFAGEHLAQFSSGMEGALESGERAAKTVLTLI